MAGSKGLSPQMISERTTFEFCHMYQVGLRPGEPFFWRLLMGSSLTNFNTTLLAHRLVLEITCSLFVLTVNDDINHNFFTKLCPAADNPEPLLFSQFVTWIVYLLAEAVLGAGQWSQLVSLMLQWTVLEPWLNSSPVPQRLDVRSHWLVHSPTSVPTAPTLVCTLPFSQLLHVPYLCLSQAVTSFLCFLSKGKNHSFLCYSLL